MRQERLFKSAVALIFLGNAGTMILAKIANLFLATIAVMPIRASIGEIIVSLMK